MIVLDASAAVAILFGTPKGEKLQRLMYSGERVVTPELYLAEITHVFSRYVAGGCISSEDGRRFLKKAAELVDRFEPLGDFIMEVLSESGRLGHSPYDLFYLVLARRRGATLYTVDKKLAKLAAKNGVNCVYDLVIGEEAWTVRADTDPARGRAYTREELLGGS